MNRRLPPPPEAPAVHSYYSDEDYLIGEFDDENDGDLVYVRWSAHHKRAYMYSYLDRPTQWVGADWTIRQTALVGIGMDPDSDYNIRVVGEIAYIHREMLDQNGMPTYQEIEDVDEIQAILDRRWEEYTPNRILVSFSVE